MRWTVEQETILFEYGHRGPQYCANLIARRFRVYRTAEATKRHASRIGAPMVVYSTCTHCGKVTKKVNRNSGLCPTCNEHRLWLEAVEEEQEIIRNLKKGGEDDEEYKRAKRLYDAQRQKNSRLKRRCGDFVDLSQKMSRTRSEGQKSFDDPEKICAPA